MLLQSHLPKHNSFYGEFFDLACQISVHSAGNSTPPHVYQSDECAKIQPCSTLLHTHHIQRPLLHHEDAHVMTTL